MSLRFAKWVVCTIITNAAPHDVSCFGIICRHRLIFQPQSCPPDYGSGRAGSVNTASSTLSKTWTLPMLIESLPALV
jgi:hypothetical protein